MGWEQRKPTPEEWAQAEAEQTMKKKASEAGVSEEEQKIAREAREDEQRVLDEKAVEEQMKAIDALDENPLEGLADEAKKEDDNGAEKAA